MAVWDQCKTRYLQRTNKVCTDSGAVWDLCETIYLSIPSQGVIPTKKTYQFNAEYQTDDLDFAVGVSLFDQNDNMVFSAWNLNECPEDAVIGRDLFDEKDFIKAVKLGMELAKQGYDDVKYVDPTGLYGPQI